MPDQTAVLPIELQKVVDALDAGSAWQVAAAIVIRTAYHAERRPRMSFERAAGQLHEDLERVKAYRLLLFV